MTKTNDAVARLRSVADELVNELPYTVEAIRELCDEVEALRNQDKELHEYMELLRARLGK